MNQSDLHHVLDIFQRYPWPLVGPAFECSWHDGTLYLSGPRPENLTQDHRTDLELLSFEYSEHFECWTKTI